MDYCNFVWWVRIIDILIFVSLLPFVCFSLELFYCVSIATNNICYCFPLFGQDSKETSSDKIEHSTEDSSVNEGLLLMVMMLKMHSN